MGELRHCLYCGTALTGARWVAHPPPGLGPQPRLRRLRLPYRGPSAYGATHPQWGFPPVARVRAAPAKPPLLRPRGLRAAAILAALAALAAWGAAIAESRRFALLLAGRTAVLDGAAVRASDSAVAVAGILALGLGAAALAAGAAAVIGCYRAGAQHAGRRPARSDRELAMRLLLPGWNLYAAGPVVIDAARLSWRASASLPRGARLLVISWWCAWAANGLAVIAAAAMGVALIWADSTQLRADAVEMHIIVDVLAGLAAGLTAALLIWLRRAWYGRRYADWVVLPPGSAPPERRDRAVAG